jgi:hypothetical protein
VKEIENATGSQADTKLFGLGILFLSMMSSLLKIIKTIDI